MSNKLHLHAQKESLAPKPYKQSHYTIGDGFRLGLGLVFGLFLGWALLWVCGLATFFLGIRGIL